jgi:hypothetical protein
MTMDIGNCRSSPILPLLRNGQTARIVVKEVMMIDFILLLLACMTALRRGVPSFLILFIVSILRIESFMTIQLITTRPIRDIRLTDIPSIHKTASDAKISTTISDMITKGWTSDSN